MFGDRSPSKKHIDHFWLSCIEQIVGPNIKKVVFALQVHETLPNGVTQQKLNVTGAFDANLNQKLQTLFESVASGYTQKGVDFAKSLLPRSES